MDYSDDVPTEQQMRWHAPIPHQFTGSANGTNGTTEGLPIGLHFTSAQRQAQRLARAGIIVVRKASR